MPNTYCTCLLSEWTLTPTHDPLTASGPWKAPGTFSELLSSHTDTEPPPSHSLFPWCHWPKPASRSHAMCSLSSRGAQVFAGGTHAEAEWMTGILVTSQDGSGPPGCRAVLGQGIAACCCVIRLQSPRQNTVKSFHTSKSQMVWYL